MAIALFLSGALLVGAVVQDLRSRQISDAYPLGLLAVALCAGLLGWDPTTWSSRAAGLGVGFGIGAALFYSGAFGGGDAKLLAGLGAVLGFWPTLSVLFYTAICGGLLGALALRKGSKEIAYAPAIAAGAFCWMVLSRVAPSAPMIWTNP